MVDLTTTNNAQPSTSVSFFSDSFVTKRGKKPLRTMGFILDLENEGNRAALMKDIKELGGKVVESIDEDGQKPFCLITDHRFGHFLEKATKQGSDKNISECCNSLPLMLRSAVQNEVRIRTYNTFKQILANLRNRIKLNHNAEKAPVKPKLEVAAKGIRKLTAPFIKLEDNDQMYAPYWKEYSSLTNFRPIYIGEQAGKSIFHKASEDFLKRKKETQNSKPRAKSHQGPGYCDICVRDCHDLQLHFTCKEHRTRITTPGFYDEVDALCGSYVKEIVVPHKKLRRRLAPEPLPLSSYDFPDVALSYFRPSSDSTDES